MRESAPGTPTLCPLCAQPVVRGLTDDEIRERVRHDLAALGGISETALAAKVGGMSRWTIRRVAHGEPVSPAMWLRLERYYAALAPPLRFRLHLAPGEGPTIRRVALGQ